MEVPVHELAGLPPPAQLTTCYTLSLAEPTTMAAAAPGNSHCPLFKLKLGDLTARHRTHACGAPERLDARLVADANEGWHSSNLKDRLAIAAEIGIELVEHPLPAQADMHLTDLASPVLLCADEAAAPAPISRGSPTATK